MATHITNTERRSLMADDYPKILIRIPRQLRDQLDLYANPGLSITGIVNAALEHTIGTNANPDTRNAVLMATATRAAQLTNTGWGANHNACVTCGTTDKRHRGHGLCSTCYDTANPRRNRARSPRKPAKEKQ